MVASTSSIISEAFLQKIDIEITNIIKKLDGKGKYYRYVDNILYIKIEINKIHSKIQFTLEEEINNTVNYLDLTIINSKPKF